MGAWVYSDLLAILYIYLPSDHICVIVYCHYLDMNTETCLESIIAGYPMQIVSILYVSMIVNVF